MQYRRANASLIAGATSRSSIENAALPTSATADGEEDEGA
jgi:hypothetical protein